MNFEDESDQVQIISETTENLRKDVIAHDKVEAVLEKIDSVTVNEIPKVEATLKKVESTTDNKVPKVGETSKKVIKDASICIDTTAQEEEKVESAKTVPEVVPVMSVFSIGPHPAEPTPIEHIKFNNPLESSGITNSEVKINQETSRETISKESLSSSISSAESQLDARAARLRSLEEQAEWLVKKVKDTKRRGNALNSRLEVLHETYGSMPVAPPMPDVLPTFRIRTAADVLNDENDSTNNDGTP